jgi:uncharacterized SAM-binding protein YcdF (DUF218 family)
MFLPETAGRRRPPRPMRCAATRVAIVVGAACVLWLAGLVWFAVPAAIESLARRTDAIVVVTGGSLRLRSGIDLLREGKGRALFVSGVDRRVGLGALLRISGSPPDWVSCCVALGHDAGDTRGNARETALWMQRQGYRSLRLVTAWYHMPRSRLEFERAMPQIEIIPHPVFPDRVRQRWWAWHGTAALLIGEYGKYLLALFRPLVERPTPHAAFASLGRPAEPPP